MAASCLQIGKASQGECALRMHKENAFAICRVDCSRNHGLLVPFRTTRQSPIKRSVGGYHSGGNNADESESFRCVSAACDRGPLLITPTRCGMRQSIGGERDMAGERC